MINKSKTKKSLKREKQIDLGDRVRKRKRTREGWRD